MVHRNIHRTKKIASTYEKLKEDERILQSRYSEIATLIELLTKELQIYKNIQNEIQDLPFFLTPLNK